MRRLVLLAATFRATCGRPALPSVLTTRGHNATRLEPARKDETLIAVAQQHTALTTLRASESASYTEQVFSRGTLGPGTERPAHVVSARDLSMRDTGRRILDRGKARRRVASGGRTISVRVLGPAHPNRCMPCTAARLSARNLPAPARPPLGADLRDAAPRLLARRNAKAESAGPRRPGRSPRPGSSRPGHSSRMAEQGVPGRVALQVHKAT